MVRQRRDRERLERRVAEEGFATYFTLLYTEHTAGRDAFVEGLRRSRDTVRQLEKSRRESVVTICDGSLSKQITLM